MKGPSPSFHNISRYKDGCHLTPLNDVNSSYNIRSAAPIHHHTDSGGVATSFDTFKGFDTTTDNASDNIRHLESKFKFNKYMHRLLWARVPTLYPGPKLADYGRHWLHAPICRHMASTTTTSTAATATTPNPKVDNRRMPPRPNKPPAQGKGKGKRPTHFLCLPLVTDESVAQLSESLEFFKSVTTTTTPDTTRSSATLTAASEDGPEPHPSPTVASNTNSGAVRDETLRLIPPAAHRPPGTFHLTLGVMDLSQEEDMTLALKLLEQIDYVDLLRAAGAGELTAEPPPRGPKQPQHHDSRPQTRSESETERGSRRGDKEEERTAEVEAQKPDTSTVTVVASATTTTTSSTKDQDHAHSGAESDSLTPSTSGPTSASLPTSLTREVTPPPTLSRSSRASAGTVNTTSTSSLSVPTTTPTPTPSISSSSIPIQTPSPLTITLHGLGTFPRPSTSRVFYANPLDTTGRLLPFGNAVRRIFQEAGLITETRPLVLHATVANLIYVRGGSKKPRGGRNNKNNKSAKNKDDGTPTCTTSSRSSSSSSSSAKARSKAVKDEDSLRWISPSATHGLGSKFIWARDVNIDRIRICKMGAEPSDIPGWGLETPLCNDGRLKSARSSGTPLMIIVTITSSGLGVAVDARNKAATVANRAEPRRWTAFVVSEAGPAALVRRTQAPSSVTVEELKEPQVVLPVRVKVQGIIAGVDSAATILVSSHQMLQAMLDFLCHMPQMHVFTRSNRASPVGIATEQPRVGVSWDVADLEVLRSSFPRLRMEAMLRSATSCLFSINQSILRLKLGNLLISSGSNFERNVEHAETIKSHPPSAVCLLEDAARGQWLGSVEQTDIVQAEETTLENVFPFVVLSINPPREVEQQLLEDSFEEVQILSPIHLPLDLERSCPLGCMYHSRVNKSSCFFANSGSIMARGMQWNAESQAAKNGYSQESGIERISSKYICFQWILRTFLR
ncbi:Six-hairpin glycosidase, partial [Aureobasidium melanogenum]